MATTLTAAGEQQARLGCALALTGGFLVIEVVGGLYTGSLALLADAGHMVTDVGGLGPALMAIRFAMRPATPERTYGYYRVEILAAAANAVALLGICFYILFEAWQRFRNPPEVASGAMLLIGAAGLIVNIAGMFVLRTGSAASLNLRGAYLELMSDTISSVGVIAAALIMRQTGWRYADPLVSAGIGLFIVPRTWRLLTDAVDVLLEGTPSDVNVTALREAIAAVPGVIGVHDLHVWALTSGTNAMSAHAVRAGDVPAEQVLAGVHQAVTCAFSVSHVTVQVESEGWEHGETHL